ncbi:RNA polymerase sigma factor [Rhodopirellula sallentina]|uniref:RNA polymerase ECF-type sigma factor n=1 Tax=Rhodopirellula sallentina SM41 TaxID=1263870 RepID=M5TW54_9BACT|nr:RNA polymerase sigma factor [Rhodopirellula sallentina]EMI53405.1 RNA polymerase ECF-type sigma factor [Rhodopirellula sallentina SM41]
MSSDANNERTLSAAERHLLTLVRSGDADGWRQFVDRYEKRLLAFAVARVDQNATAQDLVQETFVGFLQNMNRFEERSSVESFLFRILRRRVVDLYRSRGKAESLRACEIGDDVEHVCINEVPSTDATASQYARDEEQCLAQQNALCHGIEVVTREMREAEKFRDLSIVEAIFYAGLRNRQIAELMTLPANDIAVVKHRFIQRLQRQIQSTGSIGSAVPSETPRVNADLAAAWEFNRPTCPKRSTLGRYMLAILPSSWQGFVDFHVETLGCRYCLANLSEMQNASEPQPRDDRLFQSTIGFLKRESG